MPGRLQAGSQQPRRQLQRKAESGLLPPRPLERMDPGFRRGDAARLPQGQPNTQARRRSGPAADAWAGPSGPSPLLLPQAPTPGSTGHGSVRRSRRDFAGLPRVKPEGGSHHEAGRAGSALGPTRPGPGSAGLPVGAHALASSPLSRTAAFGATRTEARTPDEAPSPPFAERGTSLLTRIDPDITVRLDPTSPRRREVVAARPSLSPTRLAQPDRLTRPSPSIVQNGLKATSQTCPSGSAK